MKLQKTAGGEQCITGEHGLLIKRQKKFQSSSERPMCHEIIVLNQAILVSQGGMKLYMLRIFFLPRLWDNKKI